MSGSIHNRLKEALETVQALFYRLVLLVGESGSGKTALLQDVAQEIDAPLLNVNMIVSSALLELTTRQRSMHLKEILDQAIREYGSPVLLDNIEILFDQTLQLQPLQLLQSISRNRVILAAWSGTISNNRLTYAVAGHPEYRRYETVDALIVEIRGEGLGVRGEGCKCK